MDLLALAFDLIESGDNRSVVEGLNILGRLSPVLTLEERGLAPTVHDLNHFADVLFHFLDEFVNFSHDAHGLVDEGVNVIRVPLESVNSGLQGLIHLLDALHHQGLLDGEKGCNNVIVHLNNQVQTTGPSPVDINLGEKTTGAVRHWDVKNLEVLDLTEVPD
jgi:hypothetical protein